MCPTNGYNWPLRSSGEHLPLRPSNRPRGPAAETPGQGSHPADRAPLRSRRDPRRLLAGHHRRKGGTEGPSRQGRLIAPRNGHQTLKAGIRVRRALVNAQTEVHQPDWFPRRRVSSWYGMGAFGNARVVAAQSARNIWDLNSLANHGGLNPLAFGRLCLLATVRPVSLQPKCGRIRRSRKRLTRGLAGRPCALYNATVMVPQWLEVQCLRH